MMTYATDALYLLGLLVVYTGAVMGLVALAGAVVAIVITLLTKDN